MNTSAHRYSASTWRTALAVVAGLTAVAALGGAVALATGTSGMPADITDRFPFGSVVVGGVALFVLVALPMGVTTWLTIVGDRRAPQAAVVAGALLAAWIPLEVAFIQTFSWLQPVCAALGILVLGLGLAGTRLDDARRTADRG